MKDAAQADFFLAPDVVMLNHASYGVTTRRTAAEGERIRREIETDPTLHLGAELTARLRAQTQNLAAELGLDPAATTLCSNATSGAAAVIDSIDLPAGSTVVVLATEYSSVRRAWERKCLRANTTLITVPVPLPLQHVDQLIAQLDAYVPGEIAYLQISLVSSSSAVHFPVHAVAAWTRTRGGRLILDAAHAPGHVPVRPAEWGVSAVFGTIHKWYPTLRPVGLLWLDADLVDVVRPAEVSLTWDSDDLVERFSRPGTFDPVPRLSLDTAVTQWHDWESAGALDECRRLADLAAALLTDAGGVPTASSEFTPPRLRAFTLTGVSVHEVKTALAQARIRAWAGQGADGECILRVSPHVYNDVSDIEAIAALTKKIVREVPSH